MHGTSETLLPAEPPEVTIALERAREKAAEPGVGSHQAGVALRQVAANHPTSLAAWATLAEAALDRDDPVAAYAFARTGYHRGLDRLRANGWRGAGAVPWSHEPNRGFLRSVHGLLRAAESIGEEEEAERCRVFLLELDPADTLGARSR